METAPTRWFLICAIAYQMLPALPFLFPLPRPLTFSTGSNPIVYVWQLRKFHEIRKGWVIICLRWSVEITKWGKWKASTKIWCIIYQYWLYSICENCICVLFRFCSSSLRWLSNENFNRNIELWHIPILPHRRRYRTRAQVELIDCQLNFAKSDYTASLATKISTIHCMRNKLALSTVSRNICYFLESPAKGYRIDS